MQSFEDSNINGPLFPVKCVRKFESDLGGKVTYRGVCVSVSVCLPVRLFVSVCLSVCLSIYLHMPRVDIVHVPYMPKKGLLAKTRHIVCLLLVSTSVLDSSSLKTQELIPKLCV